MVWSLVWKYVAGAAVLAALAFGVWMYGNSREATGFDKRDTVAKLELAARQAAIYQEQEKNEKLRAEADRKFQSLKASTDAELAASGAVADRLRRTTTAAIRERDAALASGGIASEGADWIGAFASCYSEYGMLGKDAARIADKLRGLQEQIDPAAQ